MDTNQSNSGVGVTGRLTEGDLLYVRSLEAEIERLKAEKEHYIKVWSDVCDENQGLLNEIERLKAERDPYRELKAASEDPTKQIRCKSVGHWAETNSSWAHPPEEYEIRDKPKATKKVKLLAWLTSLGLAWMLEDCKVHASWIRVPSEDKEVEV